VRVGLVDCGRHIGAKGRRRDYPPATHSCQLIDGEVVAGLGHGNDEMLLAAVHRQRQLTAGNVRRNHRHGGGVRLLAVEVDELETGLAGTCPNEITLGQLAPVDQHPPRGMARPRLFGRGGLKLLFANKTLFDEYLAELSVHFGHGSLLCPRSISAGRRQS
jgi:hypothetical protein